ncbi:LysR family transcriptional regulator [Variovorax dokdonensis]|uniref:LysR family transcriptional regulator n=1 Tax=Variovorax dokdonensis TaxID=344883 RepID=A0ABT7NE31_9BURK|nr:LysR family transcriptional regulator [Variovorax dokdonensis]MDM0046177.1 LysR family transcriptional regulator [Variovorax dokdonensis]
MNITLRQLRAFVAVAEVGQFTLAASRIHISQSALSALVKELEGELGVRLFDRHTRSVRLTTSGVDFLDRARRVLQELDQALHVTREVATFNRGRVSVACATVLSTTLVVPFMKVFNTKHPGVRLELIDVAEQGIQRAVLDGIADFGIGTQIQTDPEIVATLLFRDVYRAVLPAGHAMAGKRAVPWRLLEDEPWIALSPLSPIRREIDAHIKILGINPKVAYEVSFPSTVFAMIRQRMGVSVLPANAQQMPEVQGLTFRPLTPPVPKRLVVTFRQKLRGLSPAAQLFHDMLLAWGKENLATLAPSSVPG